MGSVFVFHLKCKESRYKTLDEKFSGVLEQLKSLRHYVLQLNQAKKYL